MTVAAARFPARRRCCFPGWCCRCTSSRSATATLVRHLVDLPDGRAPRVRRGGDPAAAGRSPPPARRPPPPAARRSPCYEVGCTAELRQVTELPDGRFDIVTVGRRRFRIADVSTGAEPYLTAEVEWLPEPDGPEELADQLAPRVLARFPAVPRPDPRRRAGACGEQLPDDPTVLSHLVAATAALTVDDRQRLLAAADTAAPAARPSCGCSTARRRCCARSGRCRCRFRSGGSGRARTEHPARLGSPCVSRSRPARTSRRSSVYGDRSAPNAGSSTSPRAHRQRRPSSQLRSRTARRSVGGWIRSPTAAGGRPATGGTRPGRSGGRPARPASRRRPRRAPTASMPTGSAVAAQRDQTTSAARIPKPRPSRVNQPSAAMNSSGLRLGEDRPPWSVLITGTPGASPAQSRPSGGAEGGDHDDGGERRRAPRGRGRRRSV